MFLLEQKLLEKCREKNSALDEVWRGIDIVEVFKTLLKFQPAGEVKAFLFLILEGFKLYILGGSICLGTECHVRWSLFTLGTLLVRF